MPSFCSEPPMAAPLWQVWQPCSRNLLRPTFSASVSAFSSPARNLSKREGVTSWRSKAPIALPTLSYVTASASPGKAFLKAVT